MTLIDTLASRAVLVRPSFKVLAGTKTDRQVSKEVHDEHNATHEAGRYVANLFSKKALMPVRAAVNTARCYVYHVTMPYPVDGHRLLPSKKVIDFQHAMTDHIAEFDKAVDHFMDGYDDHIHEAERIRGEMFNLADYPGKNEARSLFRMTVDYSPVPTGDTACRMLDGIVADAIKASIDKGTAEAFEEAHASLWKRLYDGVKHLSDIVGNYKTGGPGEIKKFHDTVITNLVETCELLDEMNIQNDGMLSGFVAQVRRELTAHESDELKASRHLRQDIKSRADEVLDMMENLVK